jgi:hypothetical protein
VRRFIWGRNKSSNSLLLFQHLQVLIASSTQNQSEPTFAHLIFIFKQRIISPPAIGLKYRVHIRAQLYRYQNHRLNSQGCDCVCIFTFTGPIAILRYQIFTNRTRNNI